MKIHVALMVLRKMNLSSPKQGQEWINRVWGVGGREVSETEKWSLIILSWGRLMQFRKVLNYFPIFMIAYTYKTWTSLLEETGLRTNSSGRQYRWESEKHSGLRRMAQAAEQAQPCQPCLSLLHEHLWELARSPRELCLGKRACTKRLSCDRWWVPSAAWVHLTR